MGDFVGSRSEQTLELLAMYLHFEIAGRVRSRMLATLLSCCVACTAIGGCKKSKQRQADIATKPEPTPASKRIARYESQIRDARAALDDWQPWYDKLREINKGTQVLKIAIPGQPNAGSMTITNITQRTLYEPTLTSVPDAGTGRVSANFSNPLNTMTALAKELRGHGIDFLLVPVPAKTSVYPEMVPADLPDGPRPFLDWRMRQWYVALEMNRVEVIDLLPDFIEHRVRRYREGTPSAPDTLETVFLRKDSHWSPHGTMRAAKLIAERVKRYPWFKAARASQGIATIEEYRELTPSSPESFPAYRTRIKGETERVFGDPESPIMVVGDSYVFPKYGLADQLLKELGFRADVLFAAGATGLFQTLQRTERLKNKKLLIFVFYPAHSWMKWKPFRAIEAPTKPAPSADTL